MGIFQSFNKVFGVTGSDLRDCHAELVENDLDFNFIRMNVSGNVSNDVTCHGVEVVTSIIDFREMIVKLCLA